MRNRFPAAHPAARLRPPSPFRTPSGTPPGEDKSRKGVRSIGCKTRPGIGGNLKDFRPLPSLGH